MKSQKGYITYLILTAIAIVAVVSIVIPPLIEVTSDWTLTRAMDVLQDNGYSAFADTQGNFTVSGNMTIGGNLNVGGTMSGSFAETDDLQAVTNRGGTTTNSITVAGIRLTNDLDASSQDIRNVDDIEAATATITSVDINGGSIDGTTIGATTPTAGAFTNVTTPLVTVSGQSGSPVAKGVNHLPYILVAAYNSSTEARNAAHHLCDGTDDDVQIQAAIDSFSADGRVILTEGTFSVGTPVSITENNITLQGQGYGSVIKNNSGTNCINVDASYIILKDFVIDGNKTSVSGGNGIYGYFYRCTIDNVYVKYAHSNGIQFTGGMGNHLSNIITYQNGGDGVILRGSDTWFESCNMGDNTGDGLVLDGSTIKVDMCHIWGNLVGIRIAPNQSTTDLRISNSIIADSDREGILLTDYSLY